MNFNSMKETTLAEIKGLAKRHHTRWERNAGYSLSENQVIFCLEAENEGYGIEFGFSGPFTHGKLCPSVITDFPDTLFTFANYEKEVMGMSTIVYARF